MNILVYAGRGTSDLCVRLTLSSLHSLLGPSYDIRSITSDILKTEPWETNCALLVIPGGRDLPYCEDLDAGLVKRIQRYVRGEGGAYLGICAGAYWAGRRVEFGLGGPLEIVGPRALGFFPGTSVGPVGSSFVYDSHSGATVQSLKCADGTHSKVYCNGGCYFEADGGNGEGLDVLASYPDSRMAVISLKCGAGRVVLSGAHVEFDAGSLKPLESELPFALGELIDNDQERLALWRTILSSLGLLVPTEKILMDTPTPLRLYRFPEKLAKSMFDEIIPKYETPYSPTSAFIPEGDEASPDMSFDPANFYTLLKECPLGRPMIYAERLPSTQTLLLTQPNLANLPDGAICLAGDQLAGKGRGANSWLSSSGCLQFTLVKDHRKDAGSLSIMQYLVATAFCNGMDPEGSLDIRIKWPNDIYARAKGEKVYRKAGGILVNSVTQGDHFRLLIGFGINVHSTPWTICLNDILQSHALPLLTKETVLVRFLRTFDQLYARMSALSGQFPLPLYYKYWLHSGQIVVLAEEQIKARVEGIDGDGYLVVAPLVEGLHTMVYEGGDYQYRGACWTDAWRAGGPFESSGSD